MQQVTRGEAAAAVALGKIGPAAIAAVPALIRGAKQDRRAAVVALGKIGPPAEAAIPLLLNQLATSRWPSDRRDALIALQAIAPDDSRVHETWLRQLRGATSEVDFAASQSVLAALGPRALPHLPALLEIAMARSQTASFSDDEFRTYVLALKRMGAPRDALAALLLSARTAASAQVRSHAAETLLELAPVSEAILFDLVADADKSVRWKALRYLRTKDAPIEDKAALVTALVGALDSNAVLQEMLDVLAVSRRVQLRDEKLCQAVKNRAAKISHYVLRPAELEAVCP